MFLAVVCAVGAGVSVVMHRRGVLTASALVLIAACAITGASAVAAGTRAHAVESGPVRAAAAAGAHIGVTGTITDDPRVLTTSFADQVMVPVTASRVEIGGEVTTLSARLLVFAPVSGWEHVRLGSTVRFRARAALPDRPGLVHAVTRATGSPETVEPPPAALGWADRVRGALAAASARALPDDAGGLLPGIVVGDRSGLTAEVEDSFTAAGMSHLTAVSGANFTFLVGAVVLLAHAATLGPRTTTVLAGVMLVAFVVVARPSPSVLRAAVMGAIGLLAVLTGRRRHAMPALCTAIVLLLGLDPALAVNYGFALSATATTALVVVAPMLSAALAARSDVVRRRPVVDAIAVATAAHLVTAPVVAAMAGTFSTVAIAANVLAAPVVGPVTVVGAIAAVVAVVSVPAGAVVAGVAALPLWWLVTVADRAASIPNAVVTVPSGLAGAGIVLAAVGGFGSVVVGVYRWRSGRVRPESE